MGLLLGENVEVDMREPHGELKRAYEVADFYDQHMTLSDLKYHVFIDHDGGHFHRLTDALVLQFQNYYLVFQEHSRPEVHHAAECVVVQYGFEDAEPAIILIADVDGERMPFERAATLNGDDFGVVKMVREPDEGDFCYVFWPDGRRPEGCQHNVIGVWFGKITGEVVHLLTTLPNSLCEKQTESYEGFFQEKTSQDEIAKSPGIQTPDLST